MFIWHTYSGGEERVSKMRTQVKQGWLKEELRMLKLDLHQAYRQGDRIGVVEIQERIAGLSKFGNKGEVSLLAVIGITYLVGIAIVLFIMF